jgi:hypothetical protein
MRIDGTLVHTTAGQLQRFFSPFGRLIVDEEGSREAFNGLLEHSKRCLDGRLAMQRSICLSLSLPVMPKSSDNVL